MIASAGRPATTRLKSTFLLVLLLLLAGLAGGATTDVSALTHWGARPALWGFHLRPRHLIAPLFLHLGWLHWGCNLVSLFSVGLALEWVAGSALVLYVFLISGVGSILVSALAQPQTPAMGCSGAVLGLAMARVLQGWWTHEEDRWRITALFVVALGLTAGPRLMGLSIDMAGHAGGLALGAISYLGWRSGIGGRLVVALALLAWSGWMIRPPQVLEF